MKRAMQKKQTQMEKKNNFVGRKKAAHRSKTNPNFGYPPPEKVLPIDRCRSSLLEKLRGLKGSHILRYSLIPNDSTFEVLEFYGDSVLYERISFFLMQTRRFMSPHLLTQIRCAVVQNKNLATAYETLGLAGLLAPEQAKALLMKGKADVVEAIIGELSESCAHGGHSADTTHIRGVLDELLAYICYTGEREYFLTVNNETKSAVTSCNNISDTLPAKQRRLEEPIEAAKPSPVPEAPKKILKKPLMRVTSCTAISSPKDTSQLKEFRQGEVHPELEPMDGTKASASISTPVNISTKKQKPEQRTPPTSPTPTSVHSPSRHQGVSIPVQQLFLYSPPTTSNTSPASSPPSMTASSSPSLPFSQVLTYEMPSFSLTPLKAGPRSSSSIPTNYGSDFFCATAQLGGRSITEYNTGYM